jgi:hypothetical protein
MSTKSTQTAAAAAGQKNGNKTPEVKAKPERVYIVTKDLRISLKGAGKLPFAIGDELNVAVVGSEVRISKAAKQA